MLQESLEEGESLSEAQASGRESIPNQERLFQLVWIEFPETGREQWVGRTLALLFKGNPTSFSRPRALARLKVLRQQVTAPWETLPFLFLRHWLVGKAKTLSNTPKLRPPLKWITGFCFGFHVSEDKGRSQV
jgi:hypothetical protein